MLKQVIMNQNFSAQEYLIKIAKLLTDKINLVEDVIEYSNQEAKGLSNKDIEFLDKLGESKNSKIKKINRIDSAFLNFFEKVKMLENVKSFEELSIKRYPILFDIRIETEKIAYFGSIRTPITETSGQHNGTSGHLVGQQKLLLSFN
jgi:aspartyl/asparaginyl-tRNA synthetase